MSVGSLDELLEQLPHDGMLRFRLPLLFAYQTGACRTAVLEIQMRPAFEGALYHRYRAGCWVDDSYIQSPETHGSGELEAALIALRHQLDVIGYLHMCFYCVFGRMEPYGGRSGNGVTGHLHCFVSKREAYLKLCTPDELASFVSYHRSPVYRLRPTPPVDEFYSCDEFALRPLEGGS